MPVASTSTGRRCDATLGIPPSVNARDDAEPLRRASTISPSTARHRSDGSGPTHTHDVAPAACPAIELDRRPRDLARHAVDEVHRGARLLEVHEVGEVDAPERALRLELLRQHGDRAAARHPGVDPARQRDHQHRIAQLRERVDLDAIASQP